MIQLWQKIQSRCGYTRFLADHLAVAKTRELGYWNFDSAAAGMGSVTWMSSLANCSDRTTLTIPISGAQQYFPVWAATAPHDSDDIIQYRLALCRSKPLLTFEARFFH